MTRPDDTARMVQQFDPPARPGLLARLWAWLTRPAPVTCPRCGSPLQQHPDGGAGGVCGKCGD